MELQGWVSRIRQDIKLSYGDIFIENENTYICDVTLDPNKQEHDRLIKEYFPVYKPNPAYSTKQQLSPVFTSLETAVEFLTNFIELRNKITEAEINLSKSLKKYGEKELKGDQIYVISTEDGTRSKVGVSKHPEKRLKELQTGSPSKLELKFSTFTGKYKAYDIEKMIHALFDDTRTTGEWFFSTSETIIKKIKSILE